jgi:hypothetical protein
MAHGQCQCTQFKYSGPKQSENLIYLYLYFQRRQDLEYALLDKKTSNLLTFIYYLYFKPAIIKIIPFNHIFNVFFWGGNKLSISAVSYVFMVTLVQ